MEKSADTQHPLHELLRRRWSPRAFADRAVEPWKLLSVLEAARWAPSSGNAQPWRFFVATKERPEEYERLFGCLSAGNRNWAHAAPVLLLSVALLTRGNGKPNPTALHDLGLAAENLVLQATALDLQAHQMAGLDREAARAIYAIPDDCEPVAALALGYPGDPATLPDDLRERELARRVRQPLAELVFSGRFGQPSPLVDDQADSGAAGD